MTIKKKVMIPILEVRIIFISFVLLTMFLAKSDKDVLFEYLKC